MLELLENYRKLTELGVKMEFAVAVKATRDISVERDALLKRSYELGELRETDVASPPRLGRTG